MFWNSEFLSVSSRHDELLSQSTKLSDILFEDELLQELKTCNVNWINFLIRPEIMTELVDNITHLTEKDCFDKLLYSRIHAAYISCEILTIGVQEIFSALMQHPDHLNNILNCLIYEPDLSQKSEEEKEEAGRKESKPVKGNEIGKENGNEGEKNDKVKEKEQNQQTTPAAIVIEQKKLATKVVPQKATLISKLINCIHSTAPADLSCHITKNVEHFSKLINVLVQNIHISGSFDILSTFINITIPPESRYVFCEILARLDFVHSLINVMTLSDVEDKQRNACQLLCDIIVHGRQEASEHQHRQQNGPPAQDMLAEQLESQEAVRLMLSQMFPLNNNNNNDINKQLRSQINYVEKVNVEAQQEPEKTDRKQSTEVKSVKATDMEQSNDTSNTRNNTDGYDKENDAVTNEETSSNSKVDNNNDKNSTDSNVVQISENNDTRPTETSTTDNTESTTATTEITNDDNNVTAIICGMKVLRCLIEWRKPNNNNLPSGIIKAHETLVFNAMRKIQDVVEEYLIKFHELLLNPPKQDPIKTTFGVIQKPLGYIRLEVVNLIRALISVNSPKIIMKLVNLNTMNVIIDLFINYSWNNLLHTQVEQALCLIIKICRHDEDLFFADFWNKRLDELVVSTYLKEETADGQSNEGGEGKKDAIAKSNNDHTSTEQSQTNTKPSTTSSDLDEKHQGLETDPHSEHQRQREDQQPPKTQQTQSSANHQLTNGHGEPKKGEDTDRSKQRLNYNHEINENNEVDTPEMRSEITTTDKTPLVNDNEQEHPPQDRQQTSEQRPGPRPSSRLVTPTMFLAEQIGVPSTPSIALLHQILNDCDLIGRLLKCRNGEANFGHILQIINSIAINRDLDIIRSHLKGIETERPELFDRWNTFVSVDVASFKETSLYFDSCSPRPLNTSRMIDVSNWVDHGNRSAVTAAAANAAVAAAANHPTGSSLNNGNSSSTSSATSLNDGNGCEDTQLLTYISFTREQVLPTINVDVLPNYNHS